MWLSFSDSTDGREQATRFGSVRPLDIVFPIIGAFLCCLGCSVCVGNPRIRRVYTIPVRWADTAVLQDASRDGLLLLAGSSQKTASSRELSNSSDRRDVRAAQLEVWSVKSRRLISETVIEGEAPGPDSPVDRWFPPESVRFEFYRNSSEAVGIHGPWLVLVDLKDGVTIRRAMPDKAFLDQKFRGFHSGNLINGYALLAVNPIDNSVAAVFNAVNAPHLYVFSSGLTRPIANWDLPRYVEDMCWSPDGKTLAILYSGDYDEKGNFHGIDAHFTTVDLPDVEILDPRSGKVLERFFTGASEAKLAFSKDGRLLYFISRAPWRTESAWEVPFTRRMKGSIRVFSASDGNLVKTIGGGRGAIHNNFSISPDGRFLAADTSTYVRTFFSEDTPFCIKLGGFELIDLTDGRAIYERHHNTLGSYWDPAKFKFSPDGRYLFVDPNHGNCGAGRQIDVWMSASGTSVAVGRKEYRGGERVDVYSLSGVLSR